MTYQIHLGSNLDVLPTLPDNSVDSIVTDPPYELGFMGKSWDSSGIAYSVELWQQCLRVLKPGGHLLAFGGSRTWHRIAVAIEDAGFQVRDSIAWLYGSGFPKSLDISKAIDKSDATEARRKRDLEFVEWMRRTGIKASQANEIVGKSDVASHYFRLDQPAVATAELFDKLRPYLPEVPDYIENMIAERTVESENFKNREVIGERKQRGSQSGVVAFNTADSETEIITAPATPQAQQWEGWGTALKPAFEPVVVARKPLIGTVAENVLTHGTGGINIDGSRIGTGTGEKKIVHYPDIRGNNFQQGKESYAERGTVEREVTDKGRWPSNVILDPYTAELLDEQSGILKSGELKSGRPHAGYNVDFAQGVTERTWQGKANSGGASRFFYVAKASKRDRNEGLEELEDKTASDRPGDTNSIVTRQSTITKNFHPTVKPTDLMRYLIKLVTPPGGVVLDPFTGSGSTGKAAILEGFDFIGIELTEEYLPIIEGRLAHAEKMRAEAEAKEDEALF